MRQNPIGGRSEEHDLLSTELIDGAAETVLLQQRFNLE